MIIPPHALPEQIRSTDAGWLALLEALEPTDLRRLYTKSRQLMRCQERTDVYLTLVGAALDLAGGAVALFAPSYASGELQLVAGQQLPDTTPSEISIAPQVMAMLYERGAPVYSDSWSTAQNPLAVLSARMAGGGVVVALPLVGATQQHGLLALVPQELPLTRSQAAALSALVDDGAQALDRIMRAQEGRHEPTTGTSSRVLAAVNAVTDIGLLYSNLIDQMLNAILGQILNALSLAGGAILLYNDQTEALDLAVALAGPKAGAHSAELLGFWQAGLLARSVAEARDAANHGQLVAIGNSNDTPIATALQAAAATQLISVPLLAGGWLTGVLQVITTRDVPMGDYQTQILNILARQTAVAIENARLFAQTRNDQERTSAVVDATNDAILMFDEQRRVKIINRRARFFFGISERELQEKDIDQLGVLFNRIFEDAPFFQGWLRQLLRSATERVVTEFRIMRPETRLLQCFSAPVMDLHDRYLGRILVFRDVTREREVERMKSDFVSNVSHELRTPLTSIRGALQLILGPTRSGRPGMADDLSPRARDLLTISLNNTERLIRLINDILDVAKIEQGRIQLRREPLVTEDLCRSAAGEMSAFANSRGIVIDIEIQPRMPKILADGDRSVQILVNLLSNAIKFSEPGQRVLLSARHDGTMVCFAVRDWGRGITREDQDRLFQKFLQIDSSTTRDVGGTGLGLAISKALVEEQGGRIWLESVPKKGSTFNFTLPVAPGDAGPDQAEPGLLALLAGLGPTGAEVRARLVQAGWQVRETDQLATIPDLAQTTPVDLIVVALPAPLAAASEVLDSLSNGEATRAVPLLALGSPDGRERSGVTLLPSDASATQIAEEALAAAAKRQLHVLVVDDDPHVRPVLVRLLQRHGLRVTNVGDGLAALAAIERGHPDVVLLDVKMPGIDGTEVLRRIKENPATAKTRVIILTANDLGESLQAQVLRLGADGYLEKPITYERLISAVTASTMPDEGPHEL